MIDLTLIAQVRDARIETINRATELALARQAWEMANGDLILRGSQARERQAEVEETLRQAILAEYATTGNKAPAPGCGVKVFQKLTYDEALAFKWAKEHGIALKLDARTFEKLAKTASELRPSFVQITDEPQAQIATDLEKALAAHIAGNVNQILEAKRESLLRDES